MAESLGQNEQMEQTSIEEWVNEALLIRQSIEIRRNKFIFLDFWKLSPLINQLQQR